MQFLTSVPFPAVTHLLQVENQPYAIPLFCSKQSLHLPWTGIGRSSWRYKGMLHIPKLLMSLQAIYSLTNCFPQAQWAGEALNNVKDKTQLLAPHTLVWEDAGHHR